MEQDQTVQIIKEISSVGAGVKALHQRLDTVTDEVTQIGRTLNGSNGTPGLKTKHEVLETNHKNLVGRLKFWGSIGGAVLTAGILAFFGLA